MKQTEGSSRGSRDLQKDFWEDGFVVERAVIDAAELQLARKKAAQLHSAAIRGRCAWRYNRLIGDCPRTRAMLRCETLARREGIFGALAANPDLLGLVARCIGNPFFLTDDTLLCKPPRCRVRIPWHQDPPFDRSSSVGRSKPASCIRVGICLERSNRATGCLWVLPARHAEGCLAEPNSPEGQLPLELEPGDVSVHSASTPHCSLENSTDASRRIYYLQYTSAQEYRRRYRAFLSERLELPATELRSQFEAMIESRSRMGLRLSASINVHVSDAGVRVRPRVRASC